jgi:hypothetical protein
MWRVGDAPVRPEAARARVLHIGLAVRCRPTIFALRFLSGLTRFSAIHITSGDEHRQQIPKHADGQRQREVVKRLARRTMTAPSSA